MVLTKEFLSLVPNVMQSYMLGLEINLFKLKMIGLMSRAVMLVIKLKSSSNIWAW